MAEIQDNIFTVLEENIKLFAKRKGMSLLQLSLEIDMSEPGFHRMLSAQSLKVKTLKKIADVLGQPIQIFFEGNKTTQKIKGDNNIQANHSMVGEPMVRYQVENLQQKVEMLEKQVKDKEEIIQLLRMQKQ